jgi:hypothetical protein
VGAFIVCLLSTDERVLMGVVVLFSPAGGFVDQEGVGLINGGGTLILGTHDDVRLPFTHF